MTYRACFYLSADGQTNVLLTRPEHADLPDLELMRQAIRQAWDAYLIGNECPYIPLDILKAGLRIGIWSKS